VSIILLDLCGEIHLTNQTSSNVVRFRCLKRHASTKCPHTYGSDWNVSFGPLSTPAASHLLTIRLYTAARLEYTAPEVLRPDPVTRMFREMDTKSDIWSLGIILHKLIFFSTPYRDSEDFAALQEEIVRYEG
jgi:serine/threonine protein kinase